MNDISKDKDYQEFFAGIKELAKGLMQIRERAAIEHAPIVEEFCARKHATANEVGRMLDYLFEFADDERILLMYKKVCRRFVYEYPDTISYYIMEYRKEYDRESLIGTEYDYLLHEDNDLYDEECVKQNNKIELLLSGKIIADLPCRLVFQMTSWSYNFLFITKSSFVLH